MSGRRYSLAWIIGVLLMGGSPCWGTEAVGSAYVSFDEPVYRFLDQCEMRGLIPAGALDVKPITRVQAASHLLGIASEYHSLNDRVLRADLDYFIREFSEECLRLSKEIPPEKRSVRSVEYNPIPAIKNPAWRPVNYKDSTFRFTADPLFSIRRDWKTVSEGWNLTRRAWGVRFWGDINGKVGYYFKFVDRVERGRGEYRSREDLLEDKFGYVGPLLGGKETYYDQTDAHLALKISRLDLYFGKDRPVWGPGLDHLLLGDAGPSYNNLRIGLRLTENLRYQYLLGKLHPWDTPTYILYETDEGWTRVATVDKWMAAHRLDWRLGEDLNLGLSEALVWGDRGLDMAYLNPLNFLFSAEHDGGDQDNKLLSADLSWRILDRGRLWGSVLIDDLNTSTIGEGNPGNKTGWTAGIAVSDCGWDGLVVSLDYSRLDPYVSSHFFPVNRFTHWTSSLGSDLNPNSDRLRAMASYRPIRALEVRTSISSHRQGTIGSEIEDAITRNSTEKAFFLASEHTGYTSIKAEADWEFSRGARLEVGWTSNQKHTNVPDRAWAGVSYRIY